MKTFRLIILVAILALFLFSIPARADHNELVHFAAHVGTSFAINTVAYGACYKKNLIGLRTIQENQDDKVPCIMLAAFTTTMIGFLYKHLETNVTFPDMARSMGYNALGTGLSIGSVFLFEF